MSGTDVRLLQELLAEHFEAWARDHWPKEPVYAFGLIYSAGWPPLPVPALGTVSERDAWLAEPDAFGVGLMIWTPAEYATFDPDHEFPPQVEALAEKLVEEWNDADSDDPWHEFMGDLAARLSTADWSDLPRCDDFVVYATIGHDIESQAELERYLAASVAPATLARLRDRGLTHVRSGDDIIIDGPAKTDARVVGSVRRTLNAIRRRL